MTTIRSTHQWAGGAVWEASELNDGVSTPLEDLAGRNGKRDRESSLEVLSGASGDRFVRLPTGTTAQRPTSPEIGYVRFNTTVNNIEWWNGTLWRSPQGTDVVTFDNLNANGGVGNAANQVSVGDHGH